MVDQCHHMLLLLPPPAVRWWWVIKEIKEVINSLVAGCRLYLNHAMKSKIKRESCLTILNKYSNYIYYIIGLTIYFLNML